MSYFALDTTTLIALQRDPRRVLALLDAADALGLRLRASAVVLAEFLGGSGPAARRAADDVGSRVEIGPVDERLARRAAALQRTAIDAGVRTRPGAIDALVAADAEAEQAWLIIDGDRGAFRALADASGHLELRELNGVAPRG